MTESNIPRIAISIGDFNGIGPEIVLKSLAGANLHASMPVIIAPKAVAEHYAGFISPQPQLHFITSPESVREGEINVLQLETEDLEINPGKQSKQSGKVAMQAIETGIELCMNQDSDALVTAPISKEAVNLAGYNIPGHTEFLASKTGADSVLMMLVSGNLRVALVTTHIPIRQVAQTISAELIREKFEILRQSLISDFGITNPRIAVFGLNPHAGDGGVIGREDIEVIAPLLKELQEERIAVRGPFPADGFFGQKSYEKYDAILAMYHDQGLAPFKLLSFGMGVNFTAGLPIIRTSPDHGTAFDIAGKGIANPSSFIEAYNLAVELANNRVRES